VPPVGLAPAGSLAWASDRAGLAGPAQNKNKNKNKK